MEKEISKIIWDEYSRDKSTDLIADADGSYLMETMPFHVHLKSDHRVDNAIKYSVDGKYISFTPVSIGFDGKKLKASGKSTSSFAEKNKLNHADIFGSGISMEIETDRKLFKKIVKIDSFAALGYIPPDAKFLEITFRIETDCDIRNKAGITWDKTTECIFSEDLQLTENSKMRSVKAWHDFVNEDGEIEQKYTVCQVRIFKHRNMLYLTKILSVEFIKTAIFPIFTDITISYGSEYLFNPADTNNCQVAALTESSFVVFYTDITNLNYGTVRIGTVSGTVITYGIGTEYVFNAALSFGSVSVLSPTSILVVFRDNGSSYQGIARIGTVTGTSITFGARYTFNTEATATPIVAVLTSTLFVVSYMNSGNANYGTANVGTVSGTVITFGSKYVFNAATSNQQSIKPLNTTSFIVSFQDGGNSNYGTVRMGTVSGTVITFGSKYVFNAAITSYTSIGVISTNKFVVAFNNGGNSSYGSAIVGTISGASISFGSIYVFYSGNGTYISLSILSASTFVVVCVSAVSTQFAVVGAVLDNVITFGAISIFNSSGASYTSVAALTSASFVVVYRDWGNSNMGNSIIGLITSDGKLWNGILITKWNGVSVV